MLRNGSMPKATTPTKQLSLSLYSQKKQPQFCFPPWREPAPCFRPCRTGTCPLPFALRRSNGASPPFLVSVSDAQAHALCLLHAGEAVVRVLGVRRNRALSGLLSGAGSQVGHGHHLTHPRKVARSLRVSSTAYEFAA
eukprot:700397-Pelagomonas_calceolata.AAC.4